MKITYLKYKLINGVEKEFNFTQPIVQIKGANFSFKTVTLRLLDTKPIDKSFLFNLDIRGAFSEELLKLKHNGKSFELYSKVNKTKVSCSFKVDDVEMCKNGLVSKYNELVKEHELEMLPIIDQRSSIFFDYSPMDRKKYIQEKYIENIDEINNFKIFCSNNKNYMSRRLDHIKDNILSNKEYENLIKKIERNEEEMKDLHEKIAKVRLITSKIRANDELIRKNKVDFQPNEELEKHPFFKESIEFIKGHIDLNSAYISTAEDYDKAMEKYKEIKDLFELTKRKYEESYNEERKDYVQLSQHEIEVVNNILKEIGKEEIGIDEIKEIKQSNEKLLEQLNSTNKKQNHILTDLRDTYSNLINKKVSIEGKLITLKEMSKDGDNDCIDKACLENVKEEIKKLTNQLEEIVKEINMNVELGKNINKEIKENEEKINSIQKLIENVDTLINIHNAYDNINKFVTIDNLKEFVQIRFDLEKMKYVMERTDKPEKPLKYDEVNKLIKTNEELNNLIRYKNDSSKYYSAKKIIDEATAENEKLHVQLKEYVGSKDPGKKLSILMKETDELKSQKDVHEKNKKEFDKIQKELPYYEELVKILSPDGLPRYLSRAKLMYLENKINAAIEHYFNSNLRIHFEYDEKKLNIDIYTKTTVNKYETLSGAEQSIVKLATSLIITDMNTDIIRLDEISAFFDNENRYKYLSFLNNIVSTSEQIFVIDHNSEFTDIAGEDVQIVQM